MKKITLFTILLFTIFSCSSISPSNLNYFSKKTGGNVQNTREQMDGIASWYGPNFHNKKTANGAYKNLHLFYCLQNYFSKGKNSQKSLSPIIFPL